MGLGFTTSGRLDEHNRDDNTRSREHGPAATPKPRLPPAGKNHVAIPTTHTLKMQQGAIIKATSGVAL